MCFQRTLVLYILIGIVSWAGGRAGAGVPLLDKIKPKASAKSESVKNEGSAKVAESGDDEIEGRIKSLQASLADAQRLLAATKAEMTTSALAVFGATAEEYDQRVQLARTLTFEYERHIEQFNRLRKIRAEKPDPIDQESQLQAFLRQAPYTIDQVDALRGQIQDARLRINSQENRRTMNELEIERNKAELKNAGVQIRQLQEKLETVKGRVEENRLRWQLDLAQLADRLARARLASRETSRSSQSEDFANQTQILKFLERKLTICAANAPFTKQELAAKLDKLRENTRAMVKEMDKASAARDVAIGRLEEARAAVRQARDQLAAIPAPAATPTPSPTPTPDAAAPKSAAPPAAPPPPAPTAIDKQAVKVASLQAVADLRKEESDTAGVLYNSLRNLIYIQEEFEQKLWEVRHRVTNPNDPAQYDEAQKCITEGIDRITQAKAYFQTNLDLASSQITTLQGRLEEWKPESGDPRLMRQTLATFQTRSDAYRRGLDQMRRTERLILSWQDEIHERLSNVTWAQRVQNLSRRTQSMVQGLWNFELVVVNDTVLVDGRPMSVKDYSITVGKLICAVLILLLGSWLCHRLADYIRRVVKVRLRARDNALGLLYKLIFGAGLFLVILVTMKTLRIPLTIFAFLGGALAIGVGFGAQNLINNFISGLILLFERPIKVGDIVEVEGLRGKVVTIGGRCSRIKRFDGIDILIPNSSFLEKSVVNWTLSDLLLRLTVRIGVAYGSPVREVLRLLNRAVEDHGQVLKDPAPVIVFDDFGDNAMLFAAYFWVEQRDGVDPRVVTSDIRCRIDKLFREAEIVLAFPQRDVHLDTPRPIQVSLVGGPEHATAPAAELRQGSTIS